MDQKLSTIALKIMSVRLPKIHLDALFSATQMVSSVILRLKELVPDFIRPFKAFNSKWIEIKAKYTVEIYNRNRLLAFFSTFGKENVSIHIQDNSDIRTGSHNRKSKREFLQKMNLTYYFHLII